MFPSGKFASDRLKNIYGIYLFRVAIVDLCHAFVSDAVSERGDEVHGVPRQEPQCRGGAVQPLRAV